MAPGAEDRYTPDKVFFGSMLFMGMVAATLLILTICMVRKRSNRLKNMEAFKAGQKMMMSEDAEFLQSQLGKELKRRLLLGDMNKFEEISKKEEAKREEAQGGLHKMQSIVTNTIKMKRVTDLFRNDSPTTEKKKKAQQQQKQNKIEIKRSSTLTARKSGKDLTSLEDSLLDMSHDLSAEPVMK